MITLAGLAFLFFLFGTVFLFGATMSIVYSLLGGLVVGALARLVLPGEEKIGWFGTALIGAAGAMGGNMVSHALHLGPVLNLVASVGVAAALLTALGFRSR